MLLGDDPFGLTYPCLVVDNLPLVKDVDDIAVWVVRVSVAAAATAAAAVAAVAAEQASNNTKNGAQPILALKTDNINQFDATHEYSLIRTATGI